MNYGFRIIIASDRHLWGVCMGIDPQVQPSEQTFFCFYNFFVN